VPWGAPGGCRKGKAGCSGGKRKQDSLLFLKKKKQKDFIRLMRGDRIFPHQSHESFLVLFFKKEPLASLERDLVTLKRILHV
jgi:hypothetical protein